MTNATTSETSNNNFDFRPVKIQRTETHYLPAKTELFCLTCNTSRILRQNNRCAFCGDIQIDNSSRYYQSEITVFKDYEYVRLEWSSTYLFSQADNAIYEALQHLEKNKEYFDQFDKVEIKYRDLNFKNGQWYKASKTEIAKAKRRFG
jgi:hypothetical protein